jgi:TonB family protein
MPAKSCGAALILGLICIGAAAQSVPFVVAKQEPAYTEEARLAKLEGSVRLSLLVGADGQPRDVHVVRPLGLGLDEKAIENVRAWQFKPGSKDGTPVEMMADEEVFFRPQRSLWDWHVVRAIFQPEPGATRPVLIQVKFPATVEVEENASVTIGFDIGPTAIPSHPRVVKSSNPRWEGELLRCLRQGWRFRPGTVDDKPVTVAAWFEFVRGSHSPIPPVRVPPR